MRIRDDFIARLNPSRGHRAMQRSRARVHEDRVLHSRVLSELALKSGDFGGEGSPDDSPPYDVRNSLCFTLPISLQIFHRLIYALGKMSLTETDAAKRARALSLFKGLTNFAAKDHASVVIGIVRGARQLHMNIEERSIKETLREHRSKLVHFHIADSNRWPPSYGHLRAEEHVRLLQESNYEGWVSGETLPKPSSIEAVEATAKFLRSHKLMENK